MVDVEPKDDVSESEFGADVVEWDDVGFPTTRSTLDSSTRDLPRDLIDARQRLYSGTAGRYNHDALLGPTRVVYNERREENVLADRVIPKPKPGSALQPSRSLSSWSSSRVERRMGRHGPVNLEAPWRSHASELSADDDGGQNDSTTDDVQFQVDYLVAADADDDSHTVAESELTDMEEFEYVVGKALHDLNSQARLQPLHTSASSASL